MRHFQLLLLALQFCLVPLAAADRVIPFNRVRPKTPVFCASPNAGMIQTNSKTILDCSKDCAFNDDCVGFNHNDPGQICQQFVSPVVSLSIAPGWTFYEVSAARFNSC